jgi:hypothetical protein
VRLTTKLSILALVFATLAMLPTASATSLTFDLTQNNIAGLNGTSIGTVTITNISGGVSVNIKMDPGYGLFMNNKAGKGGKIFVSSTGSLGSGSLINLSFGTVTGFSSKHDNLAGFTFTDLYTLAGGTSQTNFTFTLSGINTSQISSLGFHFICLNGNCPGSGSNTGYVETGSPSTVPEPSTLGLLGTGLVGLAGVVRRRWSL